MAYSYPTSIVNLSAAGAVPTNGKPLRAVHFNRLAREIIALESAIGIGVAGNKTDLKTRLTQEVNDDGSYKRELLCEDDPSGNQRGTTRFLDSQWTEVTINSTSTVGGKPNVFIPVAYSAFDEPPVFIGCWNILTATGYSDPLTRNQIYALSEIGANIDVRKWDGTNIDSARTERYAWVAVSRSLSVWEEDVAWALPPRRMGP